MSKQEILQNLLIGSQGESKTQSYRRFLLEDVKKKGWSFVVSDLASWLGYSNMADVEEALLDYLANDTMTHKKAKIGSKKRSPRSLKKTLESPSSLSPKKPRKA